MSAKIVLVFCAQALLIQSALSQCTSRAAVLADPAPYGLGSPLAYDGLVGYAGLSPAAAIAPFGAALAPAAYGTLSPCGAAALAPAGYASGFAAPYGASAYGAAPYGGAGEGNVAVAGELPVAGNTAVAGQVPIMGAVNFGGPVSAAGAVSIAGQCACGCGSPYGYAF